VTPGGTVLVTGAAGRIGSCLQAGLPELGWKLRLLDRRPMPDADEGAGIVVADLSDRDALREAMQGVTAVVHLAGAVRPSDPWEVVQAANIQGTADVFQAALDASVGRVVLASSHHANGFAPRSAGSDPAGGDRPDSAYGVSKIFGEALGRLYTDRYGMAVGCIRIGTFKARPDDPRQLATWLSPRDTVGLVHACLTSPLLGYRVVYGISANTRRWWDLTPALELGYQPVDDAEAYASEVLAPYGGKDPAGPDDPQGGPAAWRDG